MNNFEGIRFFRAGEFNKPTKISKNLLRRLDDARLIAGIPFIITSSYRVESNTSHGKGTGVDIRAHTSAQRFRIVAAALQAGFTRIGVYNLHVHLDVDEQSPPNVLWVGKSQ